MAEQVYIGVGANISPQVNICRGLEMLGERVHVEATSLFYQTVPWDRPNQPHYYNGVWKVCTGISPNELKWSVLREIETALGRRRTADKSASRPLDLDVLIYGETVVDEPGLQIPDPEIVVRPFIAVPLFELAGDIIIPGSRVLLSKIVETMDVSQMRPVVELTNALKERLSS